MPTVNCGPGYIYNPDTGKCIKEGGVTAKKVLKKYGSVSRQGPCTGVVLQSARGLSYCSTASTKKASGSGSMSGTGKITIDDRLKTALREVKRTLVRKDQRIRNLKTRVDTMSKDRGSQVSSLEKQLDMCEKRVDSLISKMSTRK